MSASFSGFKFWRENHAFKGAARIGEPELLYATSESCPFDILLIKEMKRCVNSLLHLNMSRFRVPQKPVAQYSALDVVKQDLELLYEFSPSDRNYREALRTIQVYSEGDLQMLSKMRASFSLIANAVYSAFSGQRHAEELAPDILFLQGIPFARTDLEQSFRFVGVRPPDLAPRSVKLTVFLDEDFEPYRRLLNGELTQEEAKADREENWAKVIEATLTDNKGKALIHVGSEYVDQPTSAHRATLANFILPRRDD